jgi:hypothetical protein
MEDEDLSLGWIALHATRPTEIVAAAIIKSKVRIGSSYRAALDAKQGYSALITKESRSSFCFMLLLTDHH